MQIKKQVPELPVYFLVTIYNEREEQSIIDEIRAKLEHDFPGAAIFAHSSSFESNARHFNDFSLFIKEMFVAGPDKKDRLKKLLVFLRYTVTHLLKKRVEMENSFIETINWNKEANEKISGAIHQLNDSEKEKAELIKSKFSKIIHGIKIDLKEAIPELLRDCSSLVKEDSDFRTIHSELNEEMNKQIEHYVHTQLLPKFSSDVQSWLDAANEEFTESQAYLTEMADGFNILYGEERFAFNGDFKIIEDWRRDIARMTNRLQLEPINVLMRMTPSQLFMKSSGKLFGALPTNKAMIHKMYTRFIDHSDYSQAVNEITNQCIMQFELFEKSLERDINLFL